MEGFDEKRIKKSQTKTASCHLILELEKLTKMVFTSRINDDLVIKRTFKNRKLYNFTNLTLIY